MARLRISVNFLFLILAVVMILCGNGLIFLCYVVSLLFHEIGHLVMARVYGYKMSLIKFMPFGSSLCGNGICFSKKEEFFISLIGPLVNLLFVIVSKVLFEYGIFNNFLYVFYLSNIVLFIINMLPIYPLDGGRIFICILSGKFSREKLIKFSKVLCVVFSVIFMITFIITAFYTINYTFAIFAIFLISCCFEQDNSSYYFHLNNKIQSKSCALSIKEYVVDCDTKLYQIYKLISPKYLNRFVILGEENTCKGVLYEGDILKLLQKYDCTRRVGDAI